MIGPASRISARCHRLPTGARLRRGPFRECRLVGPQPDDLHVAAERDRRRPGSRSPPFLPEEPLAEADREDFDRETGRPSRRRSGRTRGRPRERKGRASRARVFSMMLKRALLRSRPLATGGRRGVRPTSARPAAAPSLSISSASSRLPGAGTRPAAASRLGDHANDAREGNLPVQEGLDRDLVGRVDDAPASLRRRTAPRARGRRPDSARLRARRNRAARPPTRSSRPKSFASRSGYESA